ncbi:MAG TPA: DUF3052 family protein [Anaerolineae bacterium]|nr:DUF3052 family protein [Anaerolineae bacterium]
MADKPRRQEQVSTRSLLDKLGVKPFQRISVIGVDDDTFWERLIVRAADTVKGRLRKDSDLIFFAADSLAELQQLARLKTYLVSNGAIWVVSRKGKAAKIKDVDVIAAAKAAGLVDNKVVSFSETHTTLRLVIPLNLRAS